MKNKRFIIIIIFLITGIIFLFCDFSIINNRDLFDEIIEKTNSKTTEFGITMEIRSNKNEEEIYNSILKKMNPYKVSSKKLLENGKDYCTEFDENNIKGYIETTKYENYNIIIVNVVEKSNKNELNKMKDKLQQCIKGKNINVKYFQYLKAEIPNNNIYIVNKEILKILKSRNASNVTSIDLNNGYSGTAYTGIYNSIESNNKLMDFNYAVCKYQSSNYIILGTPEIITTY